MRNATKLSSYAKSGLFAPQTARIANHLIELGSISGVEASAMYKTRSLPRRIKDIRDLGVAIRSEVKFDLTGQRYVRYVVE